jgi:hypothetical protein
VPVDEGAVGSGAPARNSSRRARPRSEERRRVRDAVGGCARRRPGEGGVVRRAISVPARGTVATDVVDATASTGCSAPDLCRRRRTRSCSGLEAHSVLRDCARRSHQVGVRQALESRTKSRRVPRLARGPDVEAAGRER